VTVTLAAINSPAVMRTFLDILQRVVRVTFDIVQPNLFTAHAVHVGRIRSNVLEKNIATNTDK